MLAKLKTLFASGVRVECNADEPWILIAPFGRFPTADKRHVQIVNADALNSVWSFFKWASAKIARALNLNAAVPVYRGHPDFAPSGPWGAELVPLGSVVDLRNSARGMEARIEWNAEGRAVLAEGRHVFPSAAWDCEPREGSANEIVPCALWSIGLWERPNIPGVDNVLAFNASPDDSPEPEPQPEPEPKTNAMFDALRKLLARLGFCQDDAAEDSLPPALEALETEFNAMKMKLSDADAARIKAEEEKAAAVTATNAHHDALAAMRLSRATIAAKALIVSGRITPAEEADAITTLNADTFDTAHAAFLARVPVVPSSRLNLGDKKPGISDTRAARLAINAFCEKEMERGATYDAAFAKSKTECADAWSLIDKADAAKQSDA